MSDPSTVCDGGALPAPPRGTSFGLDTDYLVTEAEMARGFEGAFRAASMGNFSSWTDADLYRAIDTEPEGPGHDEAVEEYVAELKARGYARQQQEDLENKLRSKYQI